MDEDPGSGAGDEGGPGRGEGETEPDADETLGPWDSTVHAPGHGPDAETDGDDRAGADGDDAGDPEASVAGTFAPDVPIEPEVVDPRNVVVVALGGYVGLLAIAAVITPRLTPWTMGWLTLAFLAVTGLAYAFFARTNPDT